MQCKFMTCDHFLSPVYLGHHNSSWFLQRWASILCTQKPLKNSLVSRPDTINIFASFKLCQNLCITTKYLSCKMRNSNTNCFTSRNGPWSSHRCGLASKWQVSVAKILEALSRTLLSISREPNNPEVFLRNFMDPAQEPHFLQATSSSKLL